MPSTYDILNDDLIQEIIPLNGHLYGNLTAHERKLVDLAVIRGLAVRIFDGVPGALGISTVRLTVTV